MRKGWTPAFRDGSGGVLAGSVAEAGTVRIGGIDQWVLLRGREVGNPLMVYLHGGPGSSETAFVRAYNAELEDHYTVVYWDQRGAGRSYSPKIPTASMTLEHILADLDELVDALLARFGKSKLVVLGHSWGSVVGALYAARHPTKVSAYVGVGQVADMAASEMASYAFVLAEAERRGNAKALAALRAIGPPPHEIKTLIQQRRWLNTFGGGMGPNLTMGAMMWKALRTPEASPWDLVRLVQGSMFSLRALWSDLMSLELEREAARFEVPVFFALGRRDMQVVAEVSAKYFERIEAPRKELVWFEQSGHFSAFEEPENFHRLMIETVRPLAV